MADDAVTLAVLREIRDEIRSTRTDLTALIYETNSRLDETNSRLDETNSRLGHLETAMVDLAQQQQFVVRWLKAGTRRDRRFEKDLIALTKRVDRLEARSPGSDD